MEKSAFTRAPQAFELPRGCLFTSVVILMVIVASGAALIQLFG